MTKPNCSPDRGWCGDVSLLPNGRAACNNCYLREYSQAHRDAWGVPGPAKSPPVPFRESAQRRVEIQTDPKAIQERRRQQAALPAAGVCMYRGLPTGEVDECVTCSGRIPVPLLACDKFGQCYTGNYVVQGARSCNRCLSKVNAIAPGFADPMPQEWRHPGEWCASKEEIARHDKALRKLAADPVPDPPPMTGRGIVTCGGGKYWPGVVVLAKMLRDTGSTVPLQVWYRGSCEHVSPADVDGLGVELVDADAHADRWGTNRIPTGRPELGGWAAKIYAVTHTTFEEVLFLDADSYLNADPGPLFELVSQYGFCVWDEPWTDNLRWPMVGYPGGRPKNRPPSPQGGQFLIDRRRCWLVLLLIQWVCQHSDFYWPEGRRAEWPCFGDQDAMILAWLLTGFRPHVVAAVDHKPDWGYLYWFNGHAVIEHRCFNKMIPAKTPGEARALLHYATHLGGADRAPGWFSPTEAAMLAHVCRGRSVLEWGRYAGRSTAAAASTAARVWSVDRTSSAPAAAHLARLGLADRVTLVEGDFASPKTLPPWRPDVVFVDGDHGAEAVRRDLANAAALVATGGLIAAHDYGEPTCPEVKPAADAWAAAAGWKITAQAGTLAVFSRSCPLTGLPSGLKGVPYAGAEL